MQCLWGNLFSAFSEAPVRQARSLSVLMLSGEHVVDIEEESSVKTIKAQILQRTGVPAHRQRLCRTASGWTLIVLVAPPGLDPIARAFLFDCESNPVRGLWVSEQGSCVIYAAKEVGRLRYREPAPDPHSDVGLLHSFLDPTCVWDGRLWWKASLNMCPHSVADYFASSWWNSSGAIVCVLFVATYDEGRALELRMASLEASGVICTRIQEESEHEEETSHPDVLAHT